MSLQKSNEIMQTLSNCLGTLVTAVLDIFNSLVSGPVTLSPPCVRLFPSWFINLALL